MINLLSSPLLTLFAQDDPLPGMATEDMPSMGALIGMFACPLLIAAAFVLLIVAGAWKVYEKAGQPGLAAIIPIYGTYVLTQIAGRDIIWFLLAIIPCTAIIGLPIVSMDVAKKFGKDPVYGLGLAFLPFIFYPLLGFGNARYLGSSTPLASR